MLLLWGWSSAEAAAEESKGPRRLQIPVACSVGPSVCPRHSLSLDTLLSAPYPGPEGSFQGAGPPPLVGRKWWVTQACSRLPGPQQDGAQVPTAHPHLLDVPLLCLTPPPHPQVFLGPFRLCFWEIQSTPQQEGDGKRFLSPHTQEGLPVDPNGCDRREKRTFQTRPAVLF